MEDKKEKSCFGSCCPGGKFIAGIVVGLILAGAGFGLYCAGKCAGKRACHVENAPAASATK